MSEKYQAKELCANCPNRGRAARLLARLVANERLAEGCEGRVKVSHGQIVTQVRKDDEPAPPQGTWNSLTGSAQAGGERRYSRIDWTEEIVCGRETIEPGEGEVPYTIGETILVDEDGGRVADFIKGSEQDIADHYRMVGVFKLLNSASAIQAAEERNDAAAMSAANNKIASLGFSLDAIAGRNDGEKQ